IFGNGYMAHNVAYTSIGTAYSISDQGRRGYYREFSGGNGLCLSNRSSSNAPILTVLNAVEAATTPPEMQPSETSRYSLRVSANHILGKQSKDLYPRLHLDLQRGRIGFGN